jgi:uncharacterized membrane protein
MADAGWYPKREARQFEPPPWEREQFEELERQRQARQPAEAPEPAEAAAPEPAQVAAEPVAVTAAGGPEPTAAMPAGGPGEAAEAPEGPSDERVQAMLLQLAAEEPTVRADVKVVGTGASIALMLVGVSMLAFAFVGFLRTRGSAQGAIGSLILLVIGVMIAVVGVWLGMRVTKRED